jgi:hypothetical protein
MPHTAGSVICVREHMIKYTIVYMWTFNCGMEFALVIMEAIFEERVASIRSDFNVCDYCQSIVSKVSRKSG